MTSYNLNITPLTPVHIGSGDDSVLFPYEYRLMQLKNTDGVTSTWFRQFDLPALFESEPTFKVGDLSAFVKNRPPNDPRFMIELRNYFQSLTQKSGSKCVSLELRASDTAFQYFKDKFRDSRNAIELKPFIRPPQGNAYIPGSSLKGALRGAWATSQIKDKSKIQYRKGRRGPDPDFRLDFDNETIGTYGNQKFERDPFKALKVGDTTNPILTWISLVYGKQYKNNEMIPLGAVQNLTEMTYGSLVDFGGDADRKSTLNARIIIDEIAQNNFNLSRELTLKDLLDAANTLSSEVVGQDIEFFRKGGTETVDALKVTEFVRGEIKNSQGTPNTCVTRIGWGSGFDAMSLNTLSTKPYETVTRKLADGKWPMGWVKLEWA
jgi:CRISPR type III-A-associated RAMP protein Csm5